MGGSTSRVLSNAKKHQNQSDVDLRSWQGLTSVLQLGKKHLTSPHEYAHFRDLVLQYAQRGGDAQLRAQIEEFINRFSMSHTEEDEMHEEHSNVQSHIDASKETPIPEVTQSKVLEVKKIADATTQQIFRGSTRRATPHSFVQVREESTAPQVLDVAEALELAIDTEKATQIHDAILHAVHDVESHIQKEQNIVDEITASIQTEPEKAEAVQPNIPIEQSKEHVDSNPVPPVTVEEPRVEIVPQKDVSPSLDAYKARIQEIKRLVHEEIGNPMALIDAHNEIGKKYMSALLRALKATGGGTDNASEAMAALEEATQVLRKDKGTPTESMSEHALPIAAVQKEVPTPPVLATPPAREDTQIDVTPLRDEVPQSEVIAPPTPVHTVQEEVSTPAQEPASWTHKIDITKGTATPPPENLPVHKTEVDDQVHVPAMIPTPPALSSRVQTTSPKPPVHEVPLSEVPRTQSETPTIRIPKTLSDIKESKVAKRKSGEIQQMDLFTPSITSALHELLHDWSLFAGSGFLGIGPGGKDHPLYVRLAALPMNEVLSGRFEGSDPKITREIKQYVDAWRHEQAIAYVEYETFEHYLRRVIQKILKRQGIA